MPHGCRGETHCIVSNMISSEHEGELGDMEIGGIGCSSSSSTSSFDSCSDLLGSMDVSAHSLARAKERQQEKNAIYEGFPAEEGYGGSADGKRLEVPGNGYGRFVQDQNGRSVERLKNQAGNFRKTKKEGEEANLRVDPCILEQQATEPVTANMPKPMGNDVLKKGAHMSSLTCSSPSAFNLACSSLVLPKEDATCSFRSEHDVDVHNDMEHFSSDASDFLANSVTGIHFNGITNINSEVFPFNYVKQTHDHKSNFGIKITSQAEANYDLQQLENSIKFFDLYESNTHRLVSMSSRRSSPDLKVLEQIDAVEVVGKKQGHIRSLSSGMIRKDQKFALAPHMKLKSAGMQSWLDYEETRRVYPRLDGIKDEFQYDKQAKRSITVHYGNGGRNTASNDTLGELEEATLNQTLDIKQTNGLPMFKEEQPGEIQQKRSWEISSSEGKSQDLATSASNDLGPDELFRYLESLKVDETYVDALMDTRNPLLNVESKARFLFAANYSDVAIDGPACDTLSAATSRSHRILSAKDIPFMVDLVQVVGASQRKGGSSLWERMVGVKDHTVYSIKVVSGKHEWEVQRRFRDFMNFYQQLKRIFDGRSGSSVLSPSEEVESGSRKIFGNTSPSVVQARTILIERFLQSLLQAGPPFSTASPIFWFLRPPQGSFECTGFEEHLMVQTSTCQKSVDVQLGNLDGPRLQSPSTSEGSKREQREDRCPVTIGKTIKLVLIIHQNRSLKQSLNAQHHSCDGCYKHLDYENGLIQSFAQAFGRRRPRFCEYTGQLFCSACHLNESSVVPAYVLWHWDFTPRRVSQFAKAYLDSIYDQPLLCVSTVNPYLYHRVHCLRNVKETRTKLSRVLSCMRCPSRARIVQIMGSRRYLLENNDFFTLRDLEDLSKGAFAVLPGLLMSVLKTLVLHVTKQCSVCQDSGEWCGAGILCEDLFRPIFPFNEENNVVNCSTCNAPFHGKCFEKCFSCPSCPQDWVDMKQGPDENS